jgi:hypothetical protein
MNQSATEEMNFDILVKPENGHFTAEVVGTPHLRAMGSNRQAATKALVETLEQRMDQGDLFRLSVKFKRANASQSGPQPVFCDFNPQSFHETAGIFKDDPTWMELSAEAYQSRREERDREWAQ